MTQKQHKWTPLKVYGLYRKLSIAHRGKDEEFYEKAISKITQLSPDECRKQIEDGGKIFKTMENELRTTNEISSYKELEPVFRAILKEERNLNLSASASDEKLTREEVFKKFPVISMEDLSDSEKDQLIQAKKAAQEKLPGE